MQAMERPRPKRGEGLRAAGKSLIGGVAARYRAIRRRLADMLLRGDRDYAMLSALSQEIGRMRQRIRADLQRGRDERKRKGTADKTPAVPPSAKGKAVEP